MIKTLLRQKERRREGHMDEMMEDNNIGQSSLAVLVVGVIKTMHVIVLTVRSAVLCLTQQLYLAEGLLPHWTQTVRRKH